MGEIESLFGYNKTYIITHPWILIPDIIRELKFSYQRIFRKYDDRFCWNLDYSLATYVPIWIEYSRNNHYGISMDFYDGLERDENYCYTEESDKIAQERYFEILDKISDGFKAYQEMSDVYDKDKIEELTKKFDEGFLLFHKYFHVLND